MDAQAIRERAASLPAEPGIYQFEGDGRVLYVGKAVDLRARVRSYADHRAGDSEARSAPDRSHGHRGGGAASNGSAEQSPGPLDETASGPRSERIGRMVDRADRIDFAVTDTETQALLLEANLIKRHRPRYNVRMTDDKSYPLVALTDHEFPRIEITRDPPEGATVFGPFTDKGRLETVVKAARETYGLRGCSDHKFATRDRPCLDHDIGLCSAPCVSETAIDSGGYRDDVESVVRFFEGETGALSDPLERKMEAAAADEAFERAANLRDRLAAVESLHGGGGDAVASADSPTDAGAVDVLGVAVEGESATVARLHSEAGQLVDRDRHSLSAPAGEAAGDVLAAFIAQFYAERDLPDAIICSDDPADPDLETWLAGEGVDLRVPGAGREATLVDLALKNARRTDRRDDEGVALARRLNLDSARVERVEGFDVSHAGGRSTVGSNVTFVDGDPEKSDYRRRKLDDANDDYASMRALVGWRAERAVADGDRETRPDPDLLLVDGGEGQLGAARDALAAAGWDVPVVALAKERELVVTPSGVHDWDDDDPGLHLLQRVRDEAHRFARAYHRTLRDEVSTVLDEVDGVGPEIRTRLLRRFGSVESVRSASRADLEAVDGVGPATAETLLERL